MECPYCFAELPASIFEHNCHCIYAGPPGRHNPRIAIGICCGRMLGEKTLYEEECHGRTDEEAIIEMMINTANCLGIELKREEIELPEWIKR